MRFLFSVNALQTRKKISWSWNILFNLFREREIYNIVLNVTAIYTSCYSPKLQTDHHFLSKHFNYILDMLKTIYGRKHEVSRFYNSHFSEFHYPCKQIQCKIEKHNGFTFVLFLFCLKYSMSIYLPKMMKAKIYHHSY